MSILANKYSATEIMTEIQNLLKEDPLSIDNTVAAYVLLTALTFHDHSIVSDLLVNQPFKKLRWSEEIINIWKEKTTPSTVHSVSYQNKPYLDISSKLPKRGTSADKIVSNRIEVKPKISQNQNPSKTTVHFIKFGEESND